VGEAYRQNQSWPEPLVAVQEAWGEQLYANGKDFLVYHHEPAGRVGAMGLQSAKEIHLTTRLLVMRESVRHTAVDVIDACRTGTEPK